MRLVGFGTTSATEASDQLSKLGREATLNTSQKSVAQSAGSGDTTTLTSNGSTVQSLTQSALQLDSSRASRVESLKEAVSNGQYQLDPAKIAESLTSADI